VQLEVRDEVTQSSRVLTFSRHNFFNKHLDPLISQSAQACAEDEWDDLMLAGGRSHRISYTTTKLAW